MPNLEKIKEKILEDIGEKRFKHSLRVADTAKSLANKVLEEFDADQKSFYDFQVFVKKDNDASDFPIIGYKQNKKEGFTWTKDRVAE